MMRVDTPSESVRRFRSAPVLQFSWCLERETHATSQTWSYSLRREKSRAGHTGDMIGMASARRTGTIITSHSQQSKSRRKAQRRISRKERRVYMKELISLLAGVFLFLSLAAMASAEGQKKT